jgi:hypothetical protein
MAGYFWPKNREKARMEEEIVPVERSLKAISPEEGGAHLQEAFARGKVGNYSSSLLDRITDPVEPRSYKPDAKIDDPGQRRLHPVLVTGAVCLVLMFILFLYFSYRQGR